jgi:hypothetical protein
MAVRTRADGSRLVPGGGDGCDPLMHFYWCPQKSISSIERPLILDLEGG